MNTIFFSWQADRPSAVCRNFIERCIQSAVDRLTLDIEIEEAVRNDLLVDRDTKGVPGTPAIFDTILKKIEAASVFVGDLTFVGKRDDGRPTSNPNVLIEYGYALSKLGSERIIAVVNDAYGEPSNVNLPFNLAHRRFPMSYTLAEDTSSENRKTVRDGLVRGLEGALRTIFDSTAYKAQIQSERPPSALEIAALHQQELDLEAEISGLRFGDGPAKVQRLVAELFMAIEDNVKAILAKHDFGIEFKSTFEPGGHNGSCVLRTSEFGYVVSWRRHPLDHSEPKLTIRRLEGYVTLPGEYRQILTFEQPRVRSEVHYEPTLSRDHELGWSQKMKLKSQRSFISNTELAQSCVSEMLNSIRSSHRNR